MFEQNYESTIIWQHAQKKGKLIKKLINSINTMKADYIFCSDIDNFPCITAKKTKLKNKINNINVNNILVLIKEIESWYLAGLHNKNAKKLTGHTFKKTDRIIKKQFDKLIPQKSSRINFMIEILNFFSTDIAKKKNASFKYFMEKYT